MPLRGKGLPSTWDVLAAEARQSRQAAVQVVDLAGGPGCCAAGACSFFHEWLGVNKVRSDQLFYRVNVLKSRDRVMFCGWISLKI